VHFLLKLANASLRHIILVHIRMAEISSCSLGFYEGVAMARCSIFGGSPLQMVGHLSICWPGIICAALASPTLVIFAVSHRNYLHRSYAAWPGKCMKIVTYIRGNCCCCRPVVRNDKSPRKPPGSAIHNICPPPNVYINVYLLAFILVSDPDKFRLTPELIMWQLCCGNSSYPASICTQIYNLPLAISSSGYL